MTVTATKIPALRFPEFEGEWEDNVLGRIASFSKGKGISKSELNENGALECITYGELYTKYSELVDQIYSRTDLDSNKLVLSNANDVIIPASGETHIDIATASCVLREGIALGGDLNIIRSQLNSNGVFLAYYLNNRRKNHIARLAQGSSVIHLYSSQLKLLKLYLPGPVEQQKIAAFLTTIDTRIQQLRRKKALLEQYKKGVMQQIFSQEIRFKDEEGKEFPAWEEKRLGEIGNVLMCKRIFAGETNEVKGIPFFKIGTLGGKPDAFISRELFDEYRAKYKFPRKGEILITCSGTVGKCLAYNGEESYYQDSNIVWIDNPSLVIRNDLLFYMISNINWAKLNSTTITRIYGSDLRSLLLTFPKSQSEQQKIATFLSTLDRQLNQVAQQLERMQTFKKGLLQQMFV